VQTIVITTITTVLDIESMTPSHEISISHEGVLPSNLVHALAKGGANSLIASIDDKALDAYDREPEIVEGQVENG